VHTSDLFDIYGGGPIETALINFVNHLDPNGKAGNQWPKYSLQDPKNLVFGPGGTTSIQDDTYRKQAISVLNAVLLRHPI
jgi:carboxylesterase type B